MSSTLGSGTRTGWKRRASAASFSMLARYSSSVVAPMTCSSPRARAGLSMLPASIAALAAGAARADHGVQLVDEDDQLVAVRADLVDDLLQPLLEVAPVAGAGDQAGQVELRRPACRAGCRGTSPSAIRCGQPLDDGGLADARPRRSAPGCSCVRRDSTSTVCSISSSRPITGSIWPVAGQRRSGPGRTGPGSGCRGRGRGAARRPAARRRRPAQRLRRAIRAGGQHPPGRRLRVERPAPSGCARGRCRSAPIARESWWASSSARLAAGVRDSVSAARLAAPRHGRRARRRSGVRVGAGAAEQVRVGSSSVTAHSRWSVSRSALPVLGGVRRGRRVHQFPGLLAEELGDVDALAGLASAAHVPGEEVVEGAAVGAWEVSAGHRSSVPGVAWSPTALLVLGRDLHRSSCRGGRPWARGEMDRPGHSRVTGAAKNTPSTGRPARRPAPQRRLDAPHPLRARRTYQPVAGPPAVRPGRRADRPRHALARPPIGLQPGPAERDGNAQRRADDPVGRSPPRWPR